MTRMYDRTENGVTTRITAKEALAEVNEAMIGRVVRERRVRRMSSSHGRHSIEYSNGRLVDLREVKQAKAPETDGKGRRIVIARGKRYVVDSITPARPRTEGATWWVPQAYVSYWSERNGEAFGATRSANASMKPGTVGRAIWDAIS